MAQAQGVKTQPVLNRCSKKQDKGHICYQLEDIVQMSSQSFIFSIINKHVGKKEKCAHIQTSLSTL